MIKLIQPIVSVLSVMCLTGAVSVHAEEHENADYTGLPITERANVYLPLADTVRAEFSSVEVSEAEPGCRLIEDHYD